MDIGQHTTAGNCDIAEQLVELLVVAHSQLDVARHNACLLVVASSVACQLQDLSSEVLQHSSQVDWCSSAYTLSVAACLEEAAQTGYWELQTSLGRLAGALLGISATATLA
jgi:uncharacterized membrane protein YGL010W